MAQIDYVRARNEDGIAESVPVKKFELMKDRYVLLDDEPATDPGGNPLPALAQQGGDMPKKNASIDEWRAFGLKHGLSSDQTDDMSRDDLVAHFNEES